MDHGVIFPSKQHHMSPTSICKIKNFPGVIPPDPR